MNKYWLLLGGKITSSVKNLVVKNLVVKNIVGYWVSRLTFSLVKSAQ